MDSFQQLLTEAKKANIITNQDDTQGEGLELCKFLGTLPFWCGDDTLHKKDVNYQHTAKCCTTHIVGLPRHPATNEEMPPTPYQLDLVTKVINGRKKFGDATAQLRKALKMHIKKGRQMGFTEIILRLILHLSFSRYAGANIGIMAATNGSLARKNLRRLAKLFKSIPGVVLQWIKSTKEGVCLKLVNETIVWAFPASEEAFTGDTKYKCVFVDEEAKWKLIDDSPTLNSIMPIVRTNGADLFLVSTPKGPVKMFYKIDMEHDENDFVFFVYDIWEAEGNLYTKEEIEEMIASSAEDPDQEYLCQYKTGRDSIFGTVSPEDQQGKKEWVIEEEEDDYNEEEDPDGLHWHENS